VTKTDNNPEDKMSEGRAGLEPIPGSRHGNEKKCLLSIPVLAVLAVVVAVVARGG
jgi:hypothetical protein